MRERWRWPRPVAGPELPPVEVHVLTGWSSCTVGVELEAHRWEWHLSLRVPFLHLLVSRYR